MKKTIFIFVIIGLILGFFMRPEVPFIEMKLPFLTVITRGAFLEEMDQLLIPLAKKSFNTILLGGALGGVVGYVMGTVKNKYV